VGNVDRLIYHQVVILTSVWVGVCYNTRHNVIFGRAKGRVIPLDCHGAVKV